MGSGEIGRLLAAFGITLVVVGALLILAERAGIRRLPGDLRLGDGDVQVYIPLMTCLLISVVATLLLNLFRR